MKKRGRKKQLLSESERVISKGTIHLCKHHTLNNKKNLLCIDIIIIISLTSQAHLVYFSMLSLKKFNTQIFKSCGIYTGGEGLVKYFSFSNNNPFVGPGGRVF